GGMLGMRRLPAALVAAALVVAVMVAWAGAAGAEPQQDEHLTIVINVAAGTQTVPATGPVSGTGIDVLASGRTTGRVSHDTDDIVFSNGVIHVKDAGRETDTVNPANCTLVVSTVGNFEIKGGTGAYAGIKGHGH